MVKEPILKFTTYATFPSALIPLKVMTILSPEPGGINWIGHLLLSPLNTQVQMRL